MAARKLVYWVLVLAPAILLSAVAIDSRFGEDPFVLPASFADQHDRIAAYAAPVRATAPLLLMSTVKLDVDTVEAAGRFWTDGARRGHLLPMYSSTRKENDEGVKGEIFAAKRRLSILLIEAARRRLRARQLKQAVSDLLDALEICEISKYSDFRSITGSAAVQRRGLDLLLKLEPFLAEQEREAVAYRLRELSKQQKPVATLAAMTCKQVVDVNDPAEVSAADRIELAQFTETLRACGSTSNVRSALNSTHAKCTSSGALMFFADARRGVDGQILFQEKLASAQLAFQRDGKAFLAKL